MELGNWRKRRDEDLKDELPAKVLERANVLHLSTLDSVIAAFADTPDGGIRQAANTLQAGIQRDIRDLCSTWGVKLHERTELGNWRKRRDDDIKDELMAKVLARANALYLPTLNSLLDVSADTPDGGIRQAANTLQADTQRDIRDSCSMWGVKPNERNESGKRRKRRDEDIVAESTAKVMRRANALHTARFGSSDQQARGDAVIKGECVLDENHASHVDPSGESPSLPKLNRQGLQKHITRYKASGLIRSQYATAYELLSRSTGTVLALDEKAAGSGLLHEVFKDVIDDQLQDMANARAMMQVLDQITAEDTLAESAEEPHSAYAGYERAPFNWCSYGASM